MVESSIHGDLSPRGTGPVGTVDESRAPAPRSAAVVQGSVQEPVPVIGVRVLAPVGAPLRDRTVPLSLDDLVAEVRAAGAGLEGIDPHRIAARTFAGLHDGLPRAEVDRLLVKTAASLVADEPAYSYLAGRLLVAPLHRDLERRGIRTFSDSVDVAHASGLLADATKRFVQAHRDTLDSAIDPEGDRRLTYFGLQTVLDRYLLRHPETRDPIEAPQYFLLRVACGLARNVDEALELYRLMSRLEYLPSSPTLFNSGTPHSQMSSCYLLDSPEDELEAIYGRYTDVAKLSKYAGGIGLAYHRIRSQGSLIRGTNGLSRGIVPWLKTLDASVAAVNQGGRRKGACCVYLETWHADILDFLELRDNTGDEARRTHNLNLANWVPDLFMKRVEEGGGWSLFDPKKVPHFTDLFGAAFERAYLEAEAQGLYERQMAARELYQRMMRTLAQTGNGWMTFKDACNEKSNQTGEPGTVVHSSNLCTEIVEVTSQAETAVCNLGSVNLAKVVVDGEVDFARIRATVHTAVKFLDRVIDINYYPTEAAAASNRRWRPVGLGLMGLQDVFFQLGLAFDDPRAAQISRRIQEEIYYAALDTSCRLAEIHGPHDRFHQTRAAKGLFQFDLWGVRPSEPERWEALRARMMKYGLRNSLLLAIAPTATIASIAGCYECIEPQVSNLFKRETMSGEFLQINGYLVRDLEARGLWTEEVRRAIMAAEGSIQDIEAIPEDLRRLYRTAWELPQRVLIDLAADRAPFIDQSQSLNLFLETPTIGKLSSMYMYAWKRGLKTTYYLRSRPATRIRQTSRSSGGGASGRTAGGQIGEPAAGVTSAPPAERDADTAAPEAREAGSAAPSDAERLACSLENPDACEACQ